MDLYGKRLWLESANVKIPANSSSILYVIGKEKLKNYDKKDLVLKCSLKKTDSQDLIYKNFYYFVKPKDLNLKKPEIIITEGLCKSLQCFTIKSDVVVKNVFISIPGMSVNFSDNYFDLLPGQSRTIYLPKMNFISSLDKKLVIKSLIDTY